MVDERTVIIFNDGVAFKPSLLYTGSKDTMVLNLVTKFLGFNFRLFIL